MRSKWIFFLFLAIIDATIVLANNNETGTSNNSTTTSPSVVTLSPSSSNAATLSPSGSPTFSNPWDRASTADEAREPISLARLIEVFVFGFFALFAIYGISRHHNRHLREVRETVLAERRRRNNHSQIMDDQQHEVSHNLFTEESRLERMMDNFHFQTFAAINESMKSLKEGGNYDTTNSQARLEEDEEAPPNNELSLELDKEEPSNSETPSNNNNTVSHHRRTLSFSWARQVAHSKDNECCICLEGYEPGEVICVAKAVGCNHVFHKDCVAEWLKRKDHCPLCRVDLMARNMNNEEKENEES